jgi:hypothetical protein
MKKTLILIAAVIASLAGASQGTTAPVHLTAAEALVGSFRAQGEAGVFSDSNGVPLNHYGASWANAYLVWGPTAKADAQCSSFLTLLLQNSYAGWTAKKAGFTSASPTAAVYHDAIEGNACGFRRVSDFASILPGDVLAAKYYDDSDNTGHVMLVRGAQALSTDAAGVTTWEVDVIDCSKSNHSQDSRVFTLAPGTTFATGGVGHGLMRVFTQNGGIVAYSWSFANGSTVYGPSVRHLVLGRLSG